MKLHIILILGLITLSAARPADEEYAEYEEGAEPAPPPKKVPARPLTGRRSPLAGRNNKATTTTTTTAAPANESEEAVEGDYVDEQQEATSSTTETSKKFIKSGVVRPFRSNEDLLATLKKRREQAIINKHNKPVQHEDDAEVEKEATPKPARASNNSNARGRFNKNNAKSSEPAAAAPAAEEATSAASPTRAGRRFHSRS